MITNYMNLFSFYQGDVPDELYKLDWTSKGVLKNWKFTKVWKLLESVGWKWTKGRELVSFFYLRPNCQPQPPFTNGIEYFVSEDDVMHYVTKTIEKNLAKQAQSRKRFTAEGNSNCQSTTPFNQPVRDSSASDPASNEVQVSKTAPRKKLIPVYKSAPTTDTTLLEEATTSTTDATELVDAMSAQWNVVWKILRSIGWTWDFGTQTNSWYIAPGYTVKTATSGEQKFSDEQAVRRHIRKLNMPEFKNVSAEGKRYHISDSQMSIDVTDPQNDWQLALNRRKRTARQSVSDGKQSPLSKKQKHTLEEEEINSSSRVSGNKRKFRNSKRAAPVQSRAEEADNRFSDEDKSGNDQSIAEEPTQAQVVSELFILVRYSYPK